jgi:hypothetical protein
LVEITALVRPFPQLYLGDAMMLGLPMASTPLQSGESLGSPKGVYHLVAGEETLKIKHVLSVGE